jgi:hypothetical protein
MTLPALVRAAAATAATRACARYDGAMCARLAWLSFKMLLPPPLNLNVSASEAGVQLIAVMLCPFLSATIQPPRPAPLVVAGVKDGRTTELAQGLGKQTCPSRVPRELYDPWRVHRLMKYSEPVHWRRMWHMQMVAPSPAAGARALAFARNSRGRATPCTMHLLERCDRDSN